MRRDLFVVATCFGITIAAPLYATNSLPLHTVGMADPVPNRSEDDHATLPRLAWAADGIPVCVAPQDQWLSDIMPDGTGGVFVAWQDERNAGTWPNIYAQHIRPTGVTAWTSDGIAVCTAGVSQRAPVLALDGTGGVIVAWDDNRNTGSATDTYALRVLESGLAAPGWTPNGTPLCTADEYQSLPQIASDGADGAYIVWADSRNFPVTYSIYAQRLHSDGSIASGWQVDGNVLCDTTGGRLHPAVVPDGAGGALVAWRDHRAGGELFAQRVTADGAIAPGWPSQGVLLSAGFIESRSNPVMVSDGGGGAIVAWERAGNEIYAQRFTADGAIASGWPANGVPVCTIPGLQYSPAIASDDSGGAIIAWIDRRAVIESDIYAVRVTDTGSIAHGWPAGGVGICTIFGQQGEATVAADGLGGAIVAWGDQRAGDSDVYAQRVSASGTILWSQGGVPVCTASGDQGDPLAVPDLAQGAIIAWNDARSGTSIDIFALRLNADGGAATDAGFALGRDQAFSISPTPCMADAQLLLRVPSRLHVRVAMYDVGGRRLKILLDSLLPAGPHVFTLDPSHASQLPTGVYFVRASWQGFEATRKLVVLR